jgi:hypothetical protein
MSNRKALQGFTDTSQVSLHENNKILSLENPVGSRAVVVTLNFICGRIVV